MSSVKRTILWLIAVMIVGVLGHLHGRYALEHKLRKSAGLNLEAIQHRKSKVNELTLERDSLKNVIEKAVSTRDKALAEYGVALKKLRENPVKVQTTNVKLAECDSITAASQFYRNEAQVERMSRINCEEVVAIQDTALKAQEDKLISMEFRHLDDQNSNQLLQEKLDKKSENLKTWRGIAIFSSTIIIVRAAYVLL